MSKQIPNMNKLRIGLTGNIATGKSAVEKIFASYDDFTVIDGDQISRVVCEPSQTAYNQLIEAFGAHILQQDKKIDRNILRGFLHDKDKRTTLENIVQNAIFDYSEDWFSQQKNSCSIFSGSQLIEANYHNQMDCLIVVRANPEVQISRLMVRDGVTREEAQKRITLQMPQQDKEELADFIIDNSTTLPELKVRCSEVASHIKAIQAKL
jgi:dephospho-CoA kinase